MKTANSPKKTDFLFGDMARRSAEVSSMTMRYMPLAMERVIRWETRLYDGPKRWSTTEKSGSSRYDNGCQLAQRHSSWTMSCCPFLLMLWRLEQTRDVIQATGDGAGRYTADSACSKSCKGPRKDSVV